MAFRLTHSSPVVLCLLLGSIMLVPPAASAQIQGPPKKGEAGRKFIRTPAPDFTLVAQDGKPLSLSSLSGKIVLVNFIYTTCPDVCPLLTAKFARIQQGLKKEHRDDYFLLSVTTDPETDRPEVLNSYARRFGADLHTWAFLTGDKKELPKVWNAFGIAVKRLGKGQVKHTGLTTLIDQQGVRRVNYWGDLWLEKEVLKDIASLATKGK